MQRILAIVSILLVLVLLPHSAQAHANLIESNPAANSVVAEPPLTAVLRFSEPLDRSYSRVVLIDGTGEPVATSPSTVDPNDDYALLLELPPLPNGRYTLQWRTLSTADGHTMQGVVPFAVGDPQSAEAPLVLPPPPNDPLQLPSALNVALRWTTYVALSIALGCLIFGWYVWREETWSSPEIDRSFRASLWTVALGAALLAALGSSGMLLTTSSAAEAPALSFIFGSRVGILLALRSLLLLVLALVLWRAPAQNRLRLGVALGMAALLSVSLLSHSAVPYAYDNPLVRYLATGLSIGLDWLHLLATAAWIGGLLPLLLALGSLRREEATLRAGRTTALVARFTALATACVIVLTATGLYAALRHVSSLGELWTTAYGRSLLLKLGLFVILLLLGGYNRWRVYPTLALLRARAEPDVGINASITRLRRSVSLEIAASLLLLLIVGVLTATTPAREAAQSGPGYTQRATADGVRLTLQVVRGGIAGDVFALDVEHLPAGVEPDVVLRVSMPAHEMGQQEIPLQEVEPGRWGARSTLLTMAGQWNVEAIVRATGMNPVQHTFVIDTTTPPTGANASGMTPVWLLLLLAGLLVTALSQLPADFTWRSRLQTGSLILVAAAFVAATVPYYVTRALEPDNPFTATPQVLAAGEAHYRQHCATCHGEGGRGDGPAAPSLTGMPADFTQPHLNLHTDGELFEWISDGKPGTAMPAFGDQLSDEEIWEVIVYIRWLHDQANGQNAAR